MIGGTINISALFVLSLGYQMGLHIEILSSS